MKLLTAFAAAAATLWIAAPSLAASPEYCAFYAREYVLQFEFGPDEAVTERELSDQAYYRCLNQDVEPPLPDTSAYSGGELDAASGEEPIAQGDAEIDDGFDQGGGTAEAPAAPANRDPDAVSRSGLPAWSSEWFAWCEKNFPNSFDPETGTVVPYEGARGFC